MGYFVPDSHIENLKSYKYQSEDRSLVSKYFLKPFWQRFCHLFPTWMAPNIITLSGFAFIVINVLTVFYYDPNLNTDTPRWTYFSYALGVFLYQTFDGCDGVHARRINQSGPLGELFDHSIDAINSTLSIFIFASETGMGFSYNLMLSQFAMLTNFYLSTWEEYHTHTLYLSEFSGPVEGILIVCVSLILTGIYGKQVIWHTYLFTITVGDKVIDVDTLDIVFSLAVFGLVMNALSAKRNVDRYYRNSTSSANNITQIEQDSAIKGLLPFFAYYASIALLVWMQPSFITLSFILSVGFTGAFTVGRIIVCHLTKQSFPMFNAPMLIPLCQIVLYKTCLSLWGIESNKIVFALSWLGFGLSLGVHIMFMNDIIHEFTEYLDVYALSIKRSKLT
ncbi:HN1_G0056080.mRNA.1.CDS.1 [Saccharomyces cerevisiae]|nr:HN1_G0056080.mRNA.1.CDS.1 [Saccharomyces cerevisiae]